ncbi:glycosyltransferase family 69 protein [Thelonectria olida]|uniref:Glycosyltransferase family 69 protein n=1 Tax=Thelonectria olida TaxID=1576542 RepID=A0A9P9AVX1_9HYPO|nr:glycosyltransferase family 69 protein [Thelonectria olida]
MIISRGNRLYVRRLVRSRIPKIFLFLLCIISVLDALRIHRAVADADRTPTPKPSQPPERIYIASLHWNDAHVLWRFWNEALLKLTEALGKENVFVSIHESGSWDTTKDALAALDAELARRGVPRHIEMTNELHSEMIKVGWQGEEGWVDTPTGKQKRRIPFLANLRNKTLRDLLELHKQGITFDKVLFLNDVIFTPDDVLKLLNTNNGEYAAACSLDFDNPPLYYDTFALRDTGGYPHLMQTWPYFQSSGSRNALVNHIDAVPVSSCWNGIVAMPAEPFVSSSQLKFRAVSDSLAAHHVEGSECCLIHADNPLTKTRGVFLNPRVRVGYNPTAYEVTHPSGSESWLSTWAIFRGLWANRLRRWTSFSLEAWTVRKRVKRWEKEGLGRREPGEYCLIDEMQVLADNGWAHV